MAMEYAKRPDVAPFLKSIALLGPYGVTGDCAFDAEAFRAAAAAKPETFSEFEREEETGARRRGGGGRGGRGGQLGDAKAARAAKAKAAKEPPASSLASSMELMNDLTIEDDGYIGGAAAWTAANAIAPLEKSLTRRGAYDRHSIDTDTDENDEDDDEGSSSSSSSSSRSARKTFNSAEEQQYVPTSDFAAVFGEPDELSWRMASSDALPSSLALQGTSSGAAQGAATNPRAVLSAKMAVQPLWVPALVDQRWVG